MLTVESMATALFSSLNPEEIVAYSGDDLGLTRKLLASNKATAHLDGDKVQEAVLAMCVQARAGTYQCSEDGNGPLTIVADSARVAAETYVGDNYPREIKTHWVVVTVRDAEGEHEDIRVDVDPEEPDCTADEHAFSDSKVHGHGGGVVVTETCDHCDLERITDTWAQCPHTGQQGLNSVEYRHAV